MKYPYKINMKMPSGENGLKQIYLDDRLVIGFYITRSSTKDFEYYFPQFKDLHCVYILLDNINPTKVYVGKTNNIRKRYTSHEYNDPEDWWQIELAFTNTDFANGGISEDAMSFLEYYLCIEAQRNGIKLAYNSQSPQEPPVEYIKKYELKHRYFDEISKITSAVGFPIFINNQNSKSQLTPKSKKQTFYLRINNGDCNAKATYDGEQMIIKAGSKVSSSSRTHFPHYKEFRELEDKHIIANNEFQLDYPFNSPSEAGNMIYRNKIDGRQRWKTKSGKSIKDIFD